MRRIFSCCLVTVIVVVCFSGLIFGGVWYISDKTFDELGLDNIIVMNNMTMQDLGLSDIKIRDIYIILRQLIEGVDEGDIVNHPYTDVDMNNAKSKLEGSNVYDNETGKVSFKDVDEGYIIFDNEMPIVFKDTELAALINLMISETDNNFPFSLREVNLIISQDKVKLRTVLRYDISKIKEEIYSLFPSFMRSYINIGDAIYIISNSDIYADESGKIIKGETHMVSLNNISDEIANPIMGFLVNIIKQDNDLSEMEDYSISTFFAQIMSDTFIEFIHRYGLVGEDNENLGNIGFISQDNVGSISIVPWTIHTVPIDDEVIDRK